MSNSAVASAKNRRAGIKPTIPPQQQELSNPQQPSGLTLPQVIALIDSRLIKLEKFMNEKEQNPTPVNVSMNSFSNGNLPSNINDILEEYQQRFLLLAEEINLLKDTVLKLQTYTMDVNKILLEERINILSDLGSNGDRFVLQQEDINDLPETEEKEYNESTKEEL
jgi:hypothetical protein